ncbi:MAG TPA: DUF72 domain-containing protein [Candidatus Eisenbacteria bacterium]
MDRPGLHPRLHLGTSSFSHESWVGSFYPAGAKPADFLTLYADRFDTVEIDATFYRIPSKAQARSWAAKVPDGFKIALKVPQVVTHEKLLLDCGEELSAFFDACDAMGQRLGPILFQFPYFRKDAFASVGAFLARLEPFLEALPPGRAYALEVRNRTWVGAPLLSALRRHGVAYALIDHPWMPPADELARGLDVVTSDFCYVRWLGDRKGIEARTDSWDRLIVDRTAEMERWVPTLATLLERNIELFGYFNNHYAGHAPGSIELLRRVWQRRLGGAAAT